ncbi:unnamed protein product [Polarella glacialis]|uniref:Cyclin-like domain-containing protein n=1 Tax=Polarella glacialis TaxID=89957 RepID=A0A813JTX3_POLGL|nr:unnamed protein product [Polarella glacialis]
MDDDKDLIGCITQSASLFGREADVIAEVTATLTQLASLPSYAYGDHGPAMACFDSNDVPAISIRDYVRRLNMYMDCSIECYVLAVGYIERVRWLRPDLKISKVNIHTLTLTSLVIAAKFQDDSFRSNEYYARVGGVSAKALYNLEVQFLKLMRWQSNITPEDFERCCTLIFSDSRLDQLCDGGLFRDHEPPKTFASPKRNFCASSVPKSASSASLARSASSLSPDGQSASAEQADKLAHNSSSNLSPSEEVAKVASDEVVDSGISSSCLVDKDQACCTHSPTSSSRTASHTTAAVDHSFEGSTGSSTAFSKTTAPTAEEGRAPSSALASPAASHLSYSSACVGTPRVSPNARAPEEAPEGSIGTPEGSPETGRTTEPQLWVSSRQENLKPQELPRGLPVFTQATSPSKQCRKPRWARSPGAPAPWLGALVAGWLAGSCASGVLGSFREPRQLVTGPTARLNRSGQGVF